MSAHALATDIRQSPRKVRLVADVIRGLSAPVAVRTLQTMNKRAAVAVLDVLKSAMANAEHNAKLDASTLIVSTIQVDSAFVMKRFRARAFGKAAMIRKKTSRLKIVLGEPVATEPLPAAQLTAAAKKQLTATKVPAKPKPKPRAKQPTKSSSTTSA